MATVLIIDDETDICFLLSIILKQLNLTADCAYSLNEAATAINNKNYSLILLDNHLRDGLGIDFIECIKRDSPNSKIAMITAFYTETDKLIAINRGADTMITKPFSSDIILEIVSQMLELPKLKLNL